MNIYAVIDLGTNTFHLLVAKVDSEGFELLYRERIFVKLGEQGVETIGQIPFERGVLAMKHFAEVITEFKAKKVQAIGTAALRTASNGQDFLKRVAEETGINIQTISGDREASLIHKGVSLAIPIPAEERALIMDIGGGSVEFIIANKTQVFWAQSFPIGVSVLFKKFHKSDPISAEEIANLDAYLNTVLVPLDDALSKYPIAQLIGASGTFDVLESNFTKIETHPYSSRIQLKSYPSFQEKVVKSKQIERLNMQQIPRDRADLIVVALLLLQSVFEKLDIEDLSVSHFAMKEGILSEMIKEI